MLQDNKFQGKLVQILKLEGRLVKELETLEEVYEIIP